MVQVDQIWSNSTLLDVLATVPDYEECQTLCRVMNMDDISIAIMLKYPGQGRVRGLDLAIRDQC